MIDTFKSKGDMYNYSVFRHSFGYRKKVLKDYKYMLFNADIIDSETINPDLEMIELSRDYKNLVLVPKDDVIKSFSAKVGGIVYANDKVFKIVDVDDIFKYTDLKWVKISLQEYKYMKARNSSKYGKDYNYYVNILWHTVVYNDYIEEKIRKDVQEHTFGGCLVIRDVLKQDEPKTGSKAHTKQLELLDKLKALGITVALVLQDNLKKPKYFIDSYNTDTKLFKVVQLDTLGINNLGLEEILEMREDVGSTVTDTSNGYLIQTRLEDVSITHEELSEMRNSANNKQLNNIRAKISLTGDSEHIPVIANDMTLIGFKSESARRQQPHAYWIEIKVPTNKAITKIGSHIFKDNYNTHRATLVIGSNIKEISYESLKDISSGKIDIHYKGTEQSIISLLIREKAYNNLQGNREKEYSGDYRLGYRISSLEIDAPINIRDLYFTEGLVIDFDLVQGKEKHLLNWLKSFQILGYVAVNDMLAYEQRGNIYLMDNYKCQRLIPVFIDNLIGSVSVTPDIQAEVDRIKKGLSIMQEVEGYRDAKYREVCKCVDKFSIGNRKIPKVVNLLKQDTINEIFGEDIKVTKGVYVMHMNRYELEKGAKYYTGNNSKGYLLQEPVSIMLNVLDERLYKLMKANNLSYIASNHYTRNEDSYGKITNRIDPFFYSLDVGLYDLVHHNKKADLKGRGFLDYLRKDKVGYGLDDLVKLKEIHSDIDGTTTQIYFGSKEYNSRSDLQQ